MSSNFLVVRNDEEQYAIWPAGRQAPSGWHVIGQARSKEECLKDIVALWSDILPKSVRDTVKAAGGGAPLAPRRD